MEQTQSVLLYCLYFCHCTKAHSVAIGDNDANH